MAFPKKLVLADEGFQIVLGFDRLFLLLIVVAIAFVAVPLRSVRHRPCLFMATATSLDSGKVAVVGEIAFRDLRVTRLAA